MDGRVGTNNRYFFLVDDEDDADGLATNLGEVTKAKGSKIPLKPSGNNREVKDAAAIKVTRKPALAPEKNAKNEDGEDMETVKNRRNREDRANNENKQKNSETGRFSEQRGPVRTTTQSAQGSQANQARRARRDSGDRWEPDSRSRGERRDWSGAPAAKPHPRTTTPNNRKKREFERKSGSDKTGVKAVDKREGGGAHNWGSHKDDVPAPGNLNTSEVLSGDETDGGGDYKVEADNENVADKKDDAPMELVEEVKELTLDEYKALRGKRQQPQFNLRRAGEGEDQSQWKGLVVLGNKKKNTESEDDEELENIDYPQRAGKQKHVLDIDITFKEPRRMGKPGGRGGGNRTMQRDFREPREQRDFREPRDQRNNREPRDQPADHDGSDAKPYSGQRKQFNGPREPKKENDAATTRDREAAAPCVSDEKAFPSLG